MIGYDLGFPPESALNTPDHRLIMPKCPLGLEFEFERVIAGLPTTEAWPQYWERKRDDSLHDRGMEFVFRRPFFGTDVITAVTGLCNFAKTAGYVSSIRTGLHVHVDVRDLEMNQLVNMLVLYALFEPTLYKFVGNDRDENVFCLPWYKSHGAILKISQIASTKSEKLKGVAGQLRNEKYAGLNLDPLARFGSVEFRQALTTTDVDWVYNWINVCLSLKLNSLAQIRPEWYIGFAYEFGATALGERVFGDLWPLLRYEQFEDQFWDIGHSSMLDVLNLAYKDFTFPHAAARFAPGPGSSFDRWAKGKEAPPASTQKSRTKKVSPAGGAAIPQPRVHDVAFERFFLNMNVNARAFDPPPPRPAPTYQDIPLVDGETE
jgi:hypothetical protein